MPYIVVFCVSGDVCSRYMVNGRLWFSKKPLPNVVVSHQMYFLYACWLGAVLRLDVVP
jgi:hypothetical protein